MSCFNRVPSRPRLSPKIPSCWWLVTERCWTESDGPLDASLLSCILETQLWCWIHFLFVTLKHYRNKPELWNYKHPCNLVTNSAYIFLYLLMSKMSYSPEIRMNLLVYFRLCHIQGWKKWEPVVLCFSVEGAVNNKSLFIIVKRGILGNFSQLFILIIFVRFNILHRLVTLSYIL